MFTSHRDGMGAVEMIFQFSFVILPFLFSVLLFVLLENMR